ncbi:MAG TPA: energy transducer TonB [Pyrinomonadaceae bacterium]|nr:energy transducer TonB [Pyrinomonadaceae bacterium]
MFTNLIESSADKSAFKRRSSFFLATVASYALFLCGAGVVGVLTFDAQVEAQTTDMLVEMWIPPVNRAPEPERPRDSPPVHRPRQANAPVDRNITVPERTIGVAPTNDPTRVPEKVGTEASNVPSIRGPFSITTRNVNPPSGITPDTSACVSCTGGTPKVVETVIPPIPPTPPKRTVTVSEGVIRGNAIELPRPTYPTIAKQARIQGPVNVQIVIDETGKVISAQAVKGSPMLTQAAVDAARRARFTPTKLGDQPVKVQGVITYNFLLQQ